MKSKVLPASKVLPTSVTHMAASALVIPLMVPQVVLALTAEEAATDLTAEGPLVGMQSLVVEHTALGHKRLAAGGAGKRDDVG